MWRLTDTTGQEVWDKVRERLRHTRRLWHGTLTHNVLSILHRGLFVPPTSGSTVNITGRMFGDGIYFSDQSTKALNYSHGTWSRTGERTYRCFMFAAHVVMGRELRTTAGDDRGDVLHRMFGPASTSVRTYNSLVVQAGTCGVINNEMIVPSTDQILLRYLCEFRSD